MASTPTSSAAAPAASDGEGEDRRPRAPVPGRPGVDRVLGRTVAIAVLAGFAGTPLVVLPGASDRYELPALAFLVACTLVGGTAWWARHLVVGAPRVAGTGGGAVGPLAGAVVLLLVVVTTATLRSVSPATSLTGRHGRMGGLLTDLTVVAFGLLVVAWARGRPGRLGALAVAGAISAGAGAVAVLVEVLGGGWPPPLLDPPGEPGLLGNANFSGAHLALGAPLVVALMADPARRRWRAALVVAASVGALALWLSSTRGAVLAAAAGVGLAGIVDRSLLRRWIVTTSLVLAVAGLLGTFAFAALDPVVDRDVPVLGPVLDQRNLERRNTIWAGAWDAVWERPVVGHGPDTLALTFPPRTDASLHLSPDPPDEAHNVLLDRATGAGVPAAAAIVLVLVLVAVHVRAVRPTCGPDARRWLAGFAGLLTGYVAQGLFSIDAVPLLLWGATSVAALVAVGPAPSSAGSPAPAQRVGRDAVRAAAVGALVVLLLAGLGLVAGIVVADVEGGRSQRAASLDEAVDRARRAVDLQPREPVYRLREAEPVLLAESQQPGTVDPATLRDAVAAADEALRLAPGDAEALEVAARLETLLAARTGSTVAFDRADRRWQQLEARKPVDAPVLLQRAVTLVAWSRVADGSQGDTLRAEALRLTDRGEASVRGRWAEGWLLAARLYDELGEPAAADAARSELVDRDVAPARADPYLAPLLEP